MSAFAESAMAVNRVVLQHMSLNLLEEGELYPSVENSFLIDDDSNMMLSTEKNEACLKTSLSTSQELLSGGHARYDSSKSYSL